MSFQDGLQKWMEAQVGGKEAYEKMMNDTKEKVEDNEMDTKAVDATAEKGNAAVQSMVDAIAKATSDVVSTLPSVAKSIAEAAEKQAEEDAKVEAKKPQKKAVLKPKKEEKKKVEKPIELGENHVVVNVDRTDMPVPVICIHINYC